MARGQTAALRNGEQVQGVAKLALGRKKSVDWCGVLAASCEGCHMMPLSTSYALH
jgi:predicted CxxxxCH...CXXCH cytochrome family protein